MSGKLRTFGLILILLCSGWARGQSFDDFKKQINSKFSTFQKETQQKFDNFVASIDKEFAEHLSKNFGPYHPLTVRAKSGAPKPTSVPKASREEVDKGNQIQYQSVRTQSLQHQGTLLPGIKKTEKVQFPVNNTHLNYLGWSFDFQSDQKIKNIHNNELTPRSVSDYWTEMSQTEYNHLLAQLSAAKDMLNANDWAYYQLIRKFTEKLLPERPNDQLLLQWVLLNRSRYKAKIGIADNQAYLLLPSLFTLYGKPYIAFDQLKYYIVSGKEIQLYTYDFDFPEADRVMDLRISRPFNTKGAPKSKDFTFEWQNKPITVSLQYDPIMMEFYQSVPMSDISVYLNSTGSEISENSFVQQFTPLIEGKTESEAAGLLLSFVQGAFEYKTDTEAHHHEQYFFPDELLAYPYSDCEDRAVLYAYLVKNLLHLNVMGLGFPGHMATAVHFTRQPEGDFLTWQGEKYVVADPTYTGAPIGMLMPQVQGTRAQLIPVNNEIVKADRSTALWKQLTNSGFFRGDLLQDVLFDQQNNAYVCGYFVGEAQLGEIQLKGSKDVRTGFIARIDPENKTVWATSLSGTGNNTAFNLAFSPDSSLYVYGTMEKNLTVENNEIQAENAPDVFLARINRNGKLQWVQKAGIGKLDHSSNFMFAARFNASGEKTMARLFSESEHFEQYGLTTEADGSALITGSFYATTGMNTHDFANYNTGSDFSPETALKSINDTLVKRDYEQTIAGLFAAMQLIKANSLEIKGIQVQDVFQKHNKQFIQYAKNFYDGFGLMRFMKNNSGIITIRTDDGKPLYFDKIKINNEARIKVIKYKSGNVEVQIFSGIDVGVPNHWFAMNTIKLFKDSGDLLFDFGENHITKKLNLKKEILKKTTD
ncbi:MAG: hypothetical protein JXR71_01415 [Bacteroidales bacterium]|nr:hypothetical protein [Bacteroidales bacterium]